MQNNDLPSPSYSWGITARRKDVPAPPYDECGITNTRKIEGNPHFIIMEKIYTRFRRIFDTVHEPIGEPSKITTKKKKLGLTTKVIKRIK